LISHMHVPVSQFPQYKVLIHLKSASTPRTTLPTAVIIPIMEIRGTTELP
uniref:Uncharacterized protein n=1 Tax=Pelusios castaneus TaxID=367368 RepID=A0A8C8RNQ8_9SAUR